jgi:hypothetical protein
MVSVCIAWVGIERARDIQPANGIRVRGGGGGIPVATTCFNIVTLVAELVRFRGIIQERPLSTPRLNNFPCRISHLLSYPSTYWFCSG